MCKGVLRTLCRYSAEDGVAINVVAKGYFVVEEGGGRWKKVEESGRKWKRVAANVCIAVWLSMARPAGYVGCSMDLWTITGVWRALGFARETGAVPIAKTAKPFAMTSICRTLWRWTCCRLNSATFVLPVTRAQVYLRPQLVRWECPGQECFLVVFSVCRFFFFCNPSFWLRRAIFVLDKKVPLVGTQRGGPPKKKWNGSVGAAGPVGRTGVLRVLGWRGRVRPALPDAQLKPSRCCTLVCCCHPGCVG